MGRALTDSALSRCVEPAVHDCVEEFVEAREARLRIRIEGSGPVVVLLHGWALDLDMWTPQLEALRGSYRLVAFDRRGFGLSTGTPSIERDVEDLARILDRLNVERAAVVGMSQGARVALRFGLEKPQRTACLILDGSPPLLTPHSHDLPLGRFRELVAHHGLDAFRSAWLSHPLTAIRSRDPRAGALVARMAARYRGLDLQAGEQAAAVPALEDLQQLRAPTLLINGALDSQERLQTAEELTHSLPEAASVRIAGAGHLPNLDQPDAYNAALCAFLRRSAQQHSWSK